MPPGHQSACGATQIVARSATLVPRSDTFNPDVDVYFQLLAAMARNLLHCERMAIAKITSQGLIATAVLVVCLWGCILTETRIVNAANRNLTISLARLRQMRRGDAPIPASRPLPPGHAWRTVAG
jgi:hypothetical protein